MGSEIQCTFLKYPSVFKKRIKIRLNQAVFLKTHCVIKYSSTVTFIVKDRLQYFWSFQPDKKYVEVCNSLRALCMWLAKTYFAIATIVPGHSIYRQGDKILDFQKLILHYTIL